MRLKGLVALMLSLFVLAGVALAAGAAVTLTNSSDWQLDHLYLSGDEKDTWGPDLLGDELVAAGGTAKLADVACAPHDVKIVDNAGKECVLKAVDVCGKENKWELTKEAVAACAAPAEAPAK
ncbi:MAG: hypothetical protein HYV63_19115 [Candidatus Schekmanbacteria bacterium]|nr:hypothetical protein [Candidatus Schekmanbacteria bacterium]